MCTLILMQAVTECNYISFVKIVVFSEMIQIFNQLKPKTKPTYYQPPKLSVYPGPLTPNTMCVFSQWPCCEQMSNFRLWHYNAKKVSTHHPDNFAVFYLVNKSSRTITIVLCLSLSLQCRAARRDTGNLHIS